MAEAAAAAPPGAWKRAGLVAVPVLASWLIRVTWATSRTSWIRRELIDELVRADERFILAFWHSRLFLMPFAYPGRRIAAMISRHSDGELIARTVERLGIASVRGSSTRGGSRALREALRWVRAGGDVGITPDGPRGPARRVKAGAIELARLTGLPVLPISLAYSRSRVLSSWDRFEVPYPFGRVVIACGEPLRCSRAASESDREALREALGERLDALTDECRDHLGLPPWPSPEPHRGPTSP